MSSRLNSSPNLLHARIQQYQTVPRDRSAIAKTDNTMITQGIDGRTYRLLDEEDSKVYRVMDDADLENEMLEIKQVEHDLKEMNRSVRTKGESRIRTSVPSMSAVKTKVTPSVSPSPPKENKRNNSNKRQENRSFQMEESAPVINSLIKSIEDKLPAEDVENVISMVNTIVHTYEDKLQQANKKSATLKPLRSKSADNSRMNRLHHTTDGVTAAGDSALPSDLHPPHKSLISEQLIKDQQKFLQRKKEVHDRELAKQAEEEAYEKMLRERLHKATLVDESKYRELYTRQLSSIKEKEDKIELKKKEFLAEEQKKLQEFARKQREHILRSTQEKHEMSWKEMQEIAEAKRHSKKGEVKPDNFSVPSCALPRPSKEKKIIADEESSKGFVAEDPKKVAARLQAYQQAHKEREEKLERERKEKEERKKLAKYEASKTIPIVKAMEDRQQAMELKRKKKEEEKMLKEKEEQEKKMAEEKRKIAALKSTKKEEWKDTYSAKKRAEIVAAKMKKEEEDKRRKEKEDKNKLLKSREMGAVIKTIIKETEAERAQKMGKMEVKDAQTKGEEAKQEYLQRIKENKQRILDSLKTRPSLIERHSQSLAGRKGATAGLLKVGQAISSTLADDSLDDLFGTEEKLLLKVNKE